MRVSARSILSGNCLAVQNSSINQLVSFLPASICLCSNDMRQIDAGQFKARGIVLLSTAHHCPLSVGTEGFVPGLQVQCSAGTVAIMSPYFYQGDIK